MTGLLCFDADSLDLECMMDLLDDWMRTLRGEGLILTRTDVAGSWGFAVPSGVGIVFHLIAHGSAWLRVAGQKPQLLGEGDLVILTGGVVHEVVATSTGPAEPIGDLLRRLAEHPLPGPSEATLYCGEFRPDMRSSAGSLKALPSVMHLTPACLARTPAISALMTLIAAETDRGSPGSSLVAQYLADALLIYVLRASAAEAGHAPGWLPAMQDRYLAKAFALMHAQPEAQWTVASLAHEVGLSRAAFARRFAERVGQGPLAYLTTWRMSLASRLLREQRASVTHVAQQVGYLSQAAFARAFKRHTGIAPATYRASLAA